MLKSDKMNTLHKIKELVEKMSVDTNKVYEKGFNSASIRARKYAQDIKELIPIFRKEILEEIRRHPKKVRRNNKKS